MVVGSKCGSNRGHQKRQYIPLSIIRAFNLAANVNADLDLATIFPIQGHW